MVARESSKLVHSNKVDGTEEQALFTRDSILSDLKHRRTLSFSRICK